MALCEFTVKSKRDMIKAIGTYGFLPFFRNAVPGFSIEEHVSPKVWFDGGEGVWEWKGPVIRETGCAYGKFFDKKAVFISREWFADFANFRRDGYDFDAGYEDGLYAASDKDLYELLAEREPILSKDLKACGGYGRGGKKGFDTVVTRLQMNGYAVISDFVYETDKTGKPYGWGIASYATPEKLFGKAFTDHVYKRKPEESFDRIVNHLSALFPETDKTVLIKLLRR